jgi:Bacteriophage tail assembly protein
MAAQKKATLGSMICEITESALQPSERISVSESAEKYVRLNNPGSYQGPWQNSKVPYMVKPMDILASREKEAEIFVGPSQSAKTASLVLNWMAYTVMCDPMDFILYEKSQTAAKDFSMRRVDRLHRDSPDIRAMMLNFGKSGDNVFDKRYKNGVLLTLSYPAINEMSGRPVPRVALTDYDRMNDDVEGEGSPFDVARARIRSFKKAGKIMAESSPSRDQLDPHWRKPDMNKHRGPPCGGIVGLYNRGDMQRWYWPCMQCGIYFEGSFMHLKWPESKDIMESAEGCYMMCPTCAGVNTFDQREEMNGEGRWLGPHQSVEKGKVIGRSISSDIASFWLKGPAATFATWPSLVKKFIEATQDYESTGSQQALKTTINTDQAEVFTPHGLETVTTAEELMGEAVELPRQQVPLSVRFLLAQIDVQGGHWVVQVVGIQPSEVGLHFDLVFIDRFKIDKSDRIDENGDRKDTRPSAHPEDWDLIKKYVMDRRYPLENGLGDMGIFHTVCDSGGKAGVTTNAYAYYKKLKRTGDHRKFILYKGDPRTETPRVHIELPDTNRKDRFAQARGEIPIMFLNSNVLKDQAHQMLMRKEVGGRCFFPQWFPEYFFKELVAEVRGPKGWENPRKLRNEAWDLLYCCLGQCLHFRVDSIVWDAPPPWAKPWQENFNVLLTTGNKVAKPAASKQTLAELAAQLS